MADGLVFESPVVRNCATAPDGSLTMPSASATTGYAPAATTAPGGSLTLSDASATTKWLVRSESDGAAAVRLAVPFGSSHLTESGALVLGSRPGEWIVMGDAGAVAEVVSSLDGLDSSDFVSALDWTHGRALFRVTGRDAPRMLEKVCSLDWSDPMTPDGAVASASVAKVICDITRNDTNGTPSYLIICDRSFGQYLFDVFIDAGAEFGLVAGPEPDRA